MKFETKKKLIIGALIFNTILLLVIVIARLSIDASPQQPETSTASPGR